MSQLKQTSRQQWTTLFKEAVKSAYPIDASANRIEQIKQVANRPQRLADDLNTVITIINGSGVTINDGNIPLVTLKEVQSWLSGTRMPSWKQHKAIVNWIAYNTHEDSPTFAVNLLNIFNSAVVIEKKSGFYWLFKKGRSWRLGGAYPTAEAYRWTGFTTP